MHNAQQMSNSSSSRFSNESQNASENEASVEKFVEDLSGVGIERAAMTPVGQHSDDTPAQSPRYRFHDENGEHRHELDGKPLIGTSTAVRVLNKPLTWWAAGQALTPLGWLNKNKSKMADRLKSARQQLEMLPLLTPNEYVDLLESCYRAHDTRKKTAAVAGTDMHKCLQDYIEECIYDRAGEPHTPGVTYTAPTAEVHRFAEWAYDNVQEFLWSEGHCYSERLWTGGICDAGAILKSGKIAAIDFKSSREAYFDQFIQVGGYAVAINENGLWTALGASMGPQYKTLSALVVLPFGGDCVWDDPDRPIMTTNVEGYMQAFEACIAIHKLKQAFEK